MLSSTKGTWAVWNWRYEASKEEMVANSDEINGSEKWVLMGLIWVSRFEGVFSIATGGEGLGTRAGRA